MTPLPTITKKICLLGATAVGKSSLIQRYVHDTFDEAYKTTIGVNIHTMDVAAGSRTVRLMIWDLEGENEPLQRYREDYMRGTHGYVLVVDATRAETLDIARSLQQIVTASLDGIPFVAMLNKRDVLSRWELRAHDIAKLAEEGWTIAETSAKTGENVREAFECLTQKILDADEALRAPTVPPKAGCAS